MNTWSYKKQLTKPFNVLIRTHFFQALGCNRILFQFLYEQLNFKQHTERIAIDKFGSVEAKYTFLSNHIKSMHVRSFEWWIEEWNCGKRSVEGNGMKHFHCIKLLDGYVDRRKKVHNHELGYYSFVLGSLILNCGIESVKSAIQTWRA